MHLWSFFHWSFVAYKHRSEEAGNQQTIFIVLLIGLSPILLIYQNPIITTTTNFLALTFNYNAHLCMQRFLFWTNYNCNLQNCLPLELFRLNNPDVTNYTIMVGRKF